jgi:glyoxylase-like metal-dependent hydrolase (beta-lactamase superfamily II)
MFLDRQKGARDIYRNSSHRPGNIFEVILTPGHDRDHICLFEREQGWLFTGDAYVGTRPQDCRPIEDQRQILEDLKTMRALNPRAPFPAPSNPIFEPAEKLVRP